MSLLPVIGIATQLAGRAQLVRSATRPLRRMFGRRGRRGAPSPVASAVGAAVQRFAGGRAARMPGERRRGRRGRGISATEIRGFKKVAGLLAAFGMRPRGLARPMRRRGRLFSRRRVGDGFE